MERKVIIAENQQGTTTDANRFGSFPRESFDHLLEDLGPGFKYTGFTVAITATTKVTVSAGRLYTSDGKLYFNADAGGTELDFISNLPATGKRIMAIVAFGSEIDTQTEPRTFVIDAQTRATEARVTSTISERHANISTIAGVAGPDPQRPQIPSNYLAIAWVTLNTEEVENVEMEIANQAVSLEDLLASVTTLDAWRILFGQQLEVFSQLLAALAAKIGNLASMDLVMRLIVDVTRLKEEAGLPDAYSAWGSDYFLDEAESDTAHVDYLARIEEGIRFAHAQERVASLGLQNPIDANVMVNGSNFVLPAYDEVRRLANVAAAQAPVVLGYAPVVVYTPVTYYDDHRDRFRTYYLNHVNYRPIFGPSTPSEISISQFANQAFPYWRHYPVRWRLRWGVPYYWSSRINFWWDRRHDPVWWTFRRLVGDSSFVVLSGPPYYPWPVPGPFAWEYKWHRSRWYWSDWVVNYHYWDRIKTSHSVNGSVVGQTWLNAEDGWLTGMHLFFTRKGAAGDVTVLLCETYDNGQPNPNAVLAVSAPLPPGDMLIWPKATRIAFPPTLLLQGKRYAFMCITSGNHYVATTERNQLTNGTLFYSTDQAWFQGFGDMSKDIAFELVYALFRQSRVEVQLQPAELSGGIAAIDINADAQIPEGTSLTAEVQVDGEWVPLGAPAVDSVDPPLNGLPPLLNLRLVFQGSPSAMPGITIGATSQIYTWRGRSDFKHISELREMPAPVDTVFVTVRFEAWRGDTHHSADVSLNTGSHVTAAVVVNGGTGGDYNVGDTITLANGVVLTVDTAGATTVTTVTVTNDGNVPLGGTIPSNPAAQVSSSGTGTGATFTLTWADNVETDDVMVETLAPEDDGSFEDTYAIIRKYTFNVAAPTITNYQIVIEGDTDNVLTPFHVAERIDVAVTSNFKEAEQMAKRPPRTVEGSSSSMNSPDRTYEDDKKYEVKLVGATEYPPGSGNFLSPNDYVELSGRAINQIKDRILESKEIAGPKKREFSDENSRSRKTNLTSVKAFKS